MANNKLGVYFGKDKISIVETSGTSLIASAEIPFLSLADSGGALKPEEISLKSLLNNKMKCAETIRDVLKKNKIKARKVFIGPSINDLFIRGFKMLLLNKSEMELGIQFEAKKYIPFKTEELISDYQYRMDKKAVKMDVLYIALSKDILDGIIEIFTKAGLQVSAFEPAIFALTRTLLLTKQFDPKASLALVAIDNSEVEFTVIDRGFPCFSRHMKLTASPADTDSPESAFTGKLSSEIRISLDYFRRQFSTTSSVDKILLLSKDTTDQDGLIAALKENLSLPIEKVKLANIKNVNNKLADLNMLKAYTLTLKDAVKINIGLDLAKRRSSQLISAQKVSQGKPPAPLNYKTLQQPIILALAIAAAAYVLPQTRINQLKKRLNMLRNDAASAIPANLRNSALDIIQREKDNYGNKVSLIEKLIGSKRDIGPVWNFLPQTVSRGLWLNYLRIAVIDGKEDLTIKGSAYLGDQDAEIDAVNKFQKRLESTADFMKGLKSLRLKSVSRASVDEYMVTQFEIAGD